MQVRHPIWLKAATPPGARTFALLFALESLARACLATVIPLEALAYLGSAQGVSALFFGVSLVSLTGSFAVPWLIRRTARRWVYTAGAVLLMVASIALALGSLELFALGMTLRVLGIVAMTICMNLMIMDHIARRDLNRAEPLRVFYSAGAWTLGPALGVFLWQSVAPWAPYGFSAVCVVILLGVFWVLRLRDDPGLTQPSGRVPSPQANIRRFLAQPRLVMAWLIAIGRNSWWVLFFIYTPIFAVQSGLGAEVGGLLVSGAMGFLFSLPLWARLLRRVGVRRMLVRGFIVGGLLTLLVAASLELPWLAAGLLLAAALAFVSLDTVGNMPFMLAVRPHERPEMTMVYTTYRDGADLLPPGLFALLLQAFELQVVFLVGGLAMVLVGGMTRKVHPRLGLYRGTAPSMR